MTKQIAMLSLLALGFVACKDEKVDSEDIRTSGMYAAFDVLATGNAKSTATAGLRVGGKTGTVVILTGADELVASTADTEKKMAQNGEKYTATFSGDAGGTVFNFAFNRGDEDEAAPASSVTLPDPFTLTGPGTTAQVSRAAELTVTWAASTVVLDGVATTWALDGACLFTTDGSVPTDGTLTLKGDDFHATPSAENAVADDKDDSENCTATLCIERKTAGTLDSAFDKEGGTISAVQQRCTKFVSVP
jgi:hypothetical protein